MSHAHWRIGDRYELSRELGSGPCGTVWYGRDLRTGEEHAVKVLEPGLAGEGEAASAFYALLGAVARLAHPNIVAVDEVVALDGRIALSMRLVRGESLDALLSTRGLPHPVQSALMVAQLADGLAAAHAIGVAHGDIKPTNVLCEPDGEGRYTARLTDFGMALLVPPPDSDVPGAIPPPEYLAPELAPGDSGTPAADVYALGILLYETLAGRPPFSAPQAETVAELHRDVRPPWIRGLPELLWPPVAACLEKRPEGRPAAAELAALLRDVAGLVEAEEAEPGADGGPVFTAAAAARLSDAARRAGDTLAISLAAPAAAGVAAPALPAAAASAETRAERAAHRRRVARIAEVTAAVVGIVAGIMLAIGGTGGNKGPNSTAAGAGQAGNVPLVVLSPGPVGAANSGSASPSPSSSRSPSQSPSASGSSSPSPSAPATTGAPPSTSQPPVITSTPALPPPPPPTTPPAQGPVLISFQSGKCLDTQGSQFAPGTPEVLFTCNGSAGEVWNYDPYSGELSQDNGAYCLDDTNMDTQHGTKMEIWPCKSTNRNDLWNQQWFFDRYSRLVLSNTNQCLDVTDFGTSDDTPIQIYDCGSNSNQKWRLQ